MNTLNFESQQRTQFIEITARVRALVTRAGFQQGAIVIYVPHTTAGITINENADPDVVRDMLGYINRAIPFDSPEYRHAEGNSAAHIKASFFGLSQHVLVEGGNLVLGTWQGIYFCEFDGPRQRQVFVQLLRSAE